ncbi:MAG: hypothetical protein ACREBG_07445 [Pyrinomonadaceae bacterium]
MKRRNRLFVSIVISMLVPIVFGQSSLITNETSQGPVQSTQSAETDSYHVTTREAFWKALIAARVPGGIVWKRNCGNEEVKGQPAPSGSSLRATLNQIVKADPQYAWYRENGAINLLPTNGEPDLLKVRIREFRIGKVPNLNFALERLLALPEVTKTAAELKLNQGLRLGGLSSPGQDQVTLRLYRKNVTLREALNAIACAHGSAVWQYSEWHCDGKTEFAIEFLIE